VREGRGGAPPTIECVSQRIGLRIDSSTKRLLIKSNWLGRYSKEGYGKGKKKISLTRGSVPVSFQTCYGLSNLKDVEYGCERKKGRVSGNGGLLRGTNSKICAWFNHGRCLCGGLNWKKRGKVGGKIKLFDALREKFPKTHGQLSIKPRAASLE